MSESGQEFEPRNNDLFEGGGTEREWRALRREMQRRIQEMAQEVTVSLREQLSHELREYQQRQSENHGVPSHTTTPGFSAPSVRVAGYKKPEKTVPLFNGNVHGVTSVHERQVP